MCTRSRPYGRVGQCGFGGQGVTDYIKGLRGFLQVDESNNPSSGFIMCPCKKCKMKRITHQ
jgi:hypothetical protein